MTKQSRRAIKNLLLSSNDLTLADRRLYNYLLHHAFNRLNQQLSFSLPFSKLKGVYGTGLPPILRLKESLKRLMKTLIEFEVEPEKWVLFSLLDKGELHLTTQEIYYAYNKECSHLFMNPFYLEKCLIQAHFTLKYSNLLYEILSEAFFSGENIINIEVSDLRDRLLISEKKLANFGDLKRFVLNPALHEINAYASFAVKFDTERKGMKVMQVIFQMVQKRSLSHLSSAKDIIPPQRPMLFIDQPEVETAYAYLLNAETAVRRKFFNKARKAAEKSGVIIAEEVFDQPDIWFRWVQDDLLSLTSS